jgi:hypothetical protein
MTDQATKIVVIRAREDGQEKIQEFTFEVFCEGLDARVITIPINRLSESERVGALMNDLRLLSNALTAALAKPELVDWSALPPR